MCFYDTIRKAILADPPHSADQERIGTCKDELLAMLDEDELKEAALCVFANKQDMPGALTPAQVKSTLAGCNLAPSPKLAQLCSQREPNSNVDPFQAIERL